MALIERIRAAWRREAPPVEIRTLIMLGVAGGVSCLLAATFPANPHTPVTLLRGVGALILCSSLVLWYFGERIPQWVLHALIATSTISTAAVIARAATGLGMVVVACAYLWLAIYVNFFFSRRAARLHMALIIATLVTAFLVGRASVPVEAWLFIAVSLVLPGEVIGRQSARLRHEANTDPLTGLLNRKGLAPAAERALSLADRTGIPITVALVDLDDFKLVNDREGHHEGDRLLVRMARVWEEELEPSDIFARLGGDEFVLLVLGSSKSECDHLFERLRFISPTPWSAGVVSRRPGEDLSSCLKRADATLYETKRSRTSELRPSRHAGRRPAARLDAR
jgi:diguanylate cyclase (GGDEF)-like protein